MGWFWGSKSAPTAIDNGANAPPPELSAVEATPAPLSVPEPAQQSLSRDEQSDTAFQELLREFYAEESRAQEKRIQTKDGRRKSSADSTPVDITPDSLYPTQMSCRSAFDYAMFCQSFGGQFVNVYRYGDFRSCSNHWNDFWLCMRARNYGEKEKARAIRDHYQKKAIRYKTGPSSEDIWEVRDVPVQDAMQGNLEELEARIEEWKKANPSAPDPWKQSKTFRDHKKDAAAQ
ncbi:uncharacterized protein A1O9_09204 [Exophiala aquamarina CBS 119918]|uniref:Early meiotic induction protein 1 n=1 Tax=Exophiala aquamarina CBS 119918 TaxID=1182545 RepID=A0A072P502_9EURO|nr:uncharacterized protein A1O9_09204 [Exophiala aquamarina CBS 119918]KEF54762.1 hypothetical protein A1O9_09204 [Exophiala aquamarina CBS 119918]